MRCQFRCLRAVGAADELKATVPMVAQDRWSRGSGQPVKWFLFYHISHGRASLYVEWGRLGWTDDTEKQKGSLEEEQERPDVRGGGGGEMVGWMPRWGVVSQGNRGRFGKGGQVNWQPFRDAFPLRHNNAHLIAAELQINPPQNVDPSTLHESGAENEIIRAEKSTILEEV